MGFAPVGLKEDVRRLLEINEHLLAEVLQQLFFKQVH